MKSRKYTHVLIVPENSYHQAT